jgi:hypothetical protein
MRKNTGFMGTALYSRQDTDLSPRRNVTSSATVSHLEMKTVFRSIWSKVSRNHKESNSMLG